MENFPQIRKTLSERGIELRYRELEMDSDYLDMYEDISYKDENFNLHSHIYYEILFCRNGSLQYFLGGKRYRVQKNDILIIPPGVSHGPLFLDNPNEPYIRTVMWINSHFYQICRKELYKYEPEARTLLEPPQYLLRFRGNILAQIKQVIDLMFQEKKQKRPGSELLCKGALLQFFCLLYRGRIYSDVSSPSPEHEELLDNILHYIEEHLSEKLSLRSISTKFLISQSAVGQLFKKHLGISFYRFVTERRLIEAKSLIAGNVPLKEVPDLCGFSDYSVFYKAFVKEYGISPREFKQNHLENNSNSAI